MVEVGIALGSNLGDRLANLRRGLALLPPAVRVTALSALYESAPVGVTEQPRFLNAVCLAETDLLPHPLLERLQRIEWDVGRRPGPRWGPRPLDLDILFYDNWRLEDERLTIPHPRIAERGFVLRPLADVAPRRRLPGWSVDVRAALAGVDTGDLVRLADAGWGTPAAG